MQWRNSFVCIYRDVPWPFRLGVGLGTDILGRKNQIISKFRKRRRHGPRNSEIHSDARFVAIWATNFNTVLKRKFMLQFRWRGPFSELKAVELRKQFRGKVSSEVTSHLLLLHNPYIKHVRSYGNVCTLSVRIFCTDFSPMVITCGWTLLYYTSVESSWNVMAHSDAREGKWRGNWRMEWIASTLHTTSEHGVSSITTADVHSSPASIRLNWRPHRFKWTRPFCRKTKSGFCACAITFQTQSNAVAVLT